MDYYTDSNNRDMHDHQDLSGAPQSNIDASEGPSRLAGTLAAMETLRKRVHRNNVISIVSGFVIIGIPFLGSFFSSVAGALGFDTWLMAVWFQMIPFLCVICFVLLIVMTISGGKDKIMLKKLYKDTFVVQLLKEHFDDVIYIWEKGFTKEAVRSMGLVKMGNRFHSEDYISASYKGVHFEQSDVTVKYHSSGKNAHTTIYFKGRMFAFDYPAKKTMSIQIFSENFNYRGNPVSGLKLQKVETENVQFNREYTVRAFDAHEAFYVITPQMMERIGYLKSRYHNIAIHFDNGRLYVGFNTNRDAFDIVTGKPIDQESERARIFEDVSVIKEIINILECLP